MSADFGEVFAALKPVMAKHAKRLAVKTDSAKEYGLVTKGASPFPQHKGQPLWFGQIKLGKAYVSYHLVAIYMNPSLAKIVSPALKKRMQGKSCFNFKSVPEQALLGDLERLTQAAVDDWAAKKWV